MAPNNLFLPDIDKSQINSDKNKLIDLIFKNNTKLKSYFYKIQSAKSAINKSKEEFSPQIEVSASISEQENVTYLDNKNLKSESIYLNVRIPIFQRGTEYVNLQKTNRNLRFAQKEYQANKENIIKDFNQFYEEFQFFGNLIYVL